VNDPTPIRDAVKQKYQQAALRVVQSGEASCCSFGCDPITSDLYSDDQTQVLPEEALLASLGCGNPTALADLKEGETVLDLGSGGGIDVLLSARRVGPTGFAYGLDMTDEMLALAEENKKKAGLSNVKFLKGHIEEIPLPDESVDVILSNCVINLSGDKPSVIREAFRVLKSGGRLAVSDVVVDRPMPEALRKDMEAYAGCIAGALLRDEYVSLLEGAGFADVTVVPTRRYRIEDIERSMASATIGALSSEQKAELDGSIYSAFIRARKP